MALPNANLDAYNKQLNALTGHERELFTQEVIQQISQGVAFATAVTNAVTNIKARKRIL
jgi:hypothetical protein